MGFLSSFLTSTGQSLPGIGASIDKSRMDRRKMQQDEEDRRKQDILDQMTIEKGGLGISSLKDEIARKKEARGILADVGKQQKLNETLGQINLGEGVTPGIDTSEDWVSLAKKKGAMGYMDVPEVKSAFDYEQTGAIKQSALDAAAAKAEEERTFKGEEAGKTRVLREEQQAETARHNKEMERLAGIKGAGGSGLNSYNLSEEEQASLSNAVQHGFDPYKINSRTAKIIANLDRDTGGKVQWNTAAANAMFERSSATQNTQSILNTIDPLLDNLKQKGMELKNTGFPLLNKAINIGKEQSGSADIVAFNNARDDAIAELERGLLGTGVLSDSKYMRALHNVNSAQSPKQLDAAINQMKIAIKSRLEAISVQSTRKTGLDGSSPIEKENPDPLGIR